MSQQPPSSGAVPDPPPRPGGRARALARLRRAALPRVSRSQALATVLVAALGFALVAQLGQDGATRLTGLRQSDLVQILDNVGARSDRLAAERSDLEAEQRDLTSGAAGSQAAIDAAQQRVDALGILAGTLGAEGTGVVVLVTDPQEQVTAARLLDLVQELRDAGAEAIQINSSRVVASTAFDDVSGGGVAVDGNAETAPYTVLAIGDSQTMATALEIPGGVIASLPASAHASVASQDDVKVTAVRPVSPPKFARPVPAATPSP
jgi:uncharacterized protein YlxW (UPF0749 family)